MFSMPQTPVFSPNYLYSRATASTVFQIDFSVANTMEAYLYVFVGSVFIGHVTLARGSSVILNKSSTHPL